jgi:NADH-quinone oxidoreductase subunit L
MLLLIPLLPFLGFLVNASLGRRLTKTVSGAVAVGAMAASFVVALVAVISLVGLDPASRQIVERVYSWISSGDFEAPFTLRLDPL